MNTDRNSASMVDQVASPEPAPTSSTQDGENMFTEGDSSEAFHTQGRNMRRMSFTDTSKSAKVRYRNSASLSPSLNRRRMPPNSPNQIVANGIVHLSPREASRIAPPYTSNSFDMLDMLGSTDDQNGHCPSPVNSSSTPPQVGKKKKKHKSNKSTQFTPPQSPVSQQRRRSLNQVDQNSLQRQPLSPSSQAKRVDNYNNMQSKQYSPTKRRSLISRTSDDYDRSTISYDTENKENMAPPVVSGNTSSLEQKSDCSESVTIDSTPRNTTTEEDIKELPESKPSFSIWDYLKDELTASDFDSAQDLKRERVTNLLGVPGAVEKASNLL
jgi:hypothetical protein